MDKNNKNYDKQQKNNSTNARTEFAEEYSLETNNMKGEDKNNCQKSCHDNCK